jgi:hypothetical protein
MRFERGPKLMRLVDDHMRVVDEALAIIRAAVLLLGIELPIHVLLEVLQFVEQFLGDLPHRGRLVGEPLGVGFCW